MFENGNIVTLLEYRYVLI